MSGNPTRAPRLLAWLAVFALHGLLVALGARYHSFIPDEDAYLNLARNLAARGDYSLDFPAFWHAPGQPNTYYAPGWPALLAAGYAAGGVAGCWAVLWAVWCAASVLADRLGAECGLPERARWLLVAWLGANPLYGYYHGHLMTEPAAVAFTLAILALGLRLIRRPTARAAALLGAVSAAAHLTRTQTLLPLAAVWLAAPAFVPRRRLPLLVLVFAATHLALVAPWLARMASVGATPLAVELKFGSNLYTYCGALGDGYGGGGPAVEYPPGLAELTPAARDRLLRRLALGAIAERPGDYLRACLARAGYLLSPVPNFGPGGGLKTYAMAGSTALFLYAPLLAVLAALAARRPVPPAARVLVVAVALWYGFHVLLHASVRQRLPSDAVVAALALTLWAGRRGPAAPEVRSTSARPSRPAIWYAAS